MIPSLKFWNFFFQALNIFVQFFFLLARHFTEKDNKNLSIYRLDIKWIRELGRVENRDKQPTHFTRTKVFDIFTENTIDKSCNNRSLKFSQPYFGWQLMFDFLDNFCLYSLDVISWWLGNINYHILNPHWLSKINY